MNTWLHLPGLPSIHSISLVKLILWHAHILKGFCIVSTAVTWRKSEKSLSISILRYIYTYAKSSGHFRTLSVSVIMPLERSKSLGTYCEIQQKWRTSVLQYLLWWEEEKSLEATRIQYICNVEVWLRNSWTLRSCFISVELLTDLRFNVSTCFNGFLTKDWMKKIRIYNKCSIIKIYCNYQNSK